MTRAAVLWITGLSGVGKSTLARALLQALSCEGAPPMLLDGDAVRRALPPALAEGFDRDSRLARAWHIARLAHDAARAGQSVVVATISLFAEVQAWNRAQHARFAEVWLHAPLPRLRERDPQRYAGGQPNVWGVDLVPHYPTQAELVLEQRFDAASRASHVAEALALWRRLQAP